LIILIGLKAEQLKREMTPFPLLTKAGSACVQKETPGSWAYMIERRVYISHLLHWWLFTWPCRCCVDRISNFLHAFSVLHYNYCLYPYSAL
jgi:hypothetical protein